MQAVQSYEYKTKYGNAETEKNN